jgi:uncharacterized protein YecE (DUF72 family)
MSRMRLHGIGGYRYRYSDEEQKPVYVVFNNVYMPDDAERFTRLN